MKLISQAGPVDLPIVGTLFPWQLTFIVVGLPGLLLVLVMMLTVREPARKNVIETLEGEAGAMPIRDVLAFIWLNRGTFGSIFFGYAIGGMAFYAFMFWTPEFIRRTHGWDIADAGIVFGILIAILGTAGAILGGWSCDWLTKRGYPDAALRGASSYFAVAMPFMAATPLVGSPTVMVIVLGFAAFTMSLQQGLSPVAIQLATPNQMRAQVTAIYFVIASFSAIAFGATSVALLTDYVFQDDAALRYSLAIVAAVCMSGAAIILGFGVKPYRGSLKRAEAWSDQV